MGGSGAGEWDIVGAAKIGSQRLLDILGRINKWRSEEKNNLILSATDRTEARLFHKFSTFYLSLIFICINLGDSVKRK